MKILKMILVVVAIIVVILLIIGLFSKKAYTVESEIMINKPKQEVFDYIKLLKNADNYNKWVMSDPNMKKDYTGTDGSTGFIYAWDSKLKNAGKGEQEIKAVHEGEEVQQEIRFIKPFEGRADVWMNTESGGAGQTKVKWRFSSGMNYPMNVMMVFIDIPGMLKKDLDTSLTNLKNILEK